MKLSKLIPLTVLSLCAAAIGVRASEVPLFITTLSLKVSGQNTITTNGSVATALPPLVKTYTIANLISQMGSDLSTDFTGGKLAVISSNDNSSFVITDSTGTNILADVTQFFHVADGDFGVEVASGAQDISTGLASPKLTRSHIFRIGFDDTGIGSHSGNLTFYVQGIMTETKSDTAPSNGTYSEARTAKMLNAVGEGTTPDGTPFLCTGSLMGSGKRSGIPTP